MLCALAWTWAFQSGSLHVPEVAQLPPLLLV